MNYPSSELVIDPLLIGKYDVGGPRYTSYPTADRFVEAFGEATLRYWLSTRNIGGITRPLALHVHCPACPEMRVHRAGSKRATRNAVSSARYIDHLEREIGLTAGLLGERHVTQIHWSGTPILLGQDALRTLCKVLETEFVIAADCEVSIAVDPGNARSGVAAWLRELGFTRVSLGAQHFDAAVQDAAVQKEVIRAEATARTCRVVEEMRASGFHTINFDVTYGLPRQTLISFNDALDAVIALDPDRITLHSPAHLPSWGVPRNMAQAGLPSTETRLQILTLAIGRLVRAGYLYIGMNHFAKAGDDLAVAQRQGRLRHNSQGYSSLPECDLLGFGPSAISRVGPSYSHNVRDFNEYYAALDAGRLPVKTGLVLNKDDLVRRAVMQALLCQFRLSIDSIQASYLLDFRRYFARELEELAALEDDGLVEIQSDGIVVTPRGRLLVQTVCMVFDRYAREGRRWAGACEVLQPPLCLQQHSAEK